MANQNTDDEMPWRDEETLREEYVHRNRSSTELGIEWDCSGSTVNSWVRKYGLEKPWRDEETLREEYVHKQRSSRELAEEWGCSSSTVGNWVKKYGFDKYSQLPKFTLGPRKSEERLDGSRNSTPTYEHFEGGPNTRIPHHRLLAVAEWGLDAIRGKHVHHQNNIPWDNRPDNLELLTPQEHSQRHQDTEMVDGEPWYAEDNLRRLYHELEWPSSEIAEKYDVHPSSVRDHMEKHGIERRSDSQATRLRDQELDEKPWRDEETLREEYVHKQRLPSELAEEWGCHTSTIRRWAREYGFTKYCELPDFTLGSEKSEVTSDGKRRHNSSYESYNSGFSVMHHRLLAVAEWGLDAIRGKDVHHQNGIRWDNRPDNLELLTRAEHRREHCGTEMVDGEPWYAEDNLRRLYHELEWSTYDIAEKYDVGTTTVNNHMEKHGIERRSKSEANRLCHQDGQQQTLDSFSKRSSGDD